MKLFLTPWLAPLSLLALFFGSLLSTLFIPPSSTEFIFRFFYSIYFHVLAFGTYLAWLYFILGETSPARIVIASINGSFSLVTWYFFISLATANYSFVS